MAYQLNAYLTKLCMKQLGTEVIVSTVKETPMVNTVKIVCSAFIDASMITNALIVSAIKTVHWVNNVIQLVSAAVNRALLEINAIDVFRIITI